MEREITTTAASMPQCRGYYRFKSKNKIETCKNCDRCFKYKRYRYERDVDKCMGFVRISDFRKCGDYKSTEQIEKHILLTSVYNIIYVNDIACISVLDIGREIEKQDAETKKIYGALKKRRDSYNHIINEILGDEIYLLSEYNSNMDEYAQEKIEKLHNSILNVLVSNNVQNAKFIATCETARTLIGYSVWNIHNRIKDCIFFNNGVENWRKYELEDMKRIVENLSDWTTRNIGGIDFNKQEGIMAAYRDLDKTLTDAKIINECITKAKEYYYGHN